MYLLDALKVAIISKEVCVCVSMCICACVREVGRIYGFECTFVFWKRMRVIVCVYECVCVCVCVCNIKLNMGHLTFS